MTNRKPRVCADCVQPVRYDPVSKSWFHDLGEAFRSIETISRNTVIASNQKPPEKVIPIPDVWYNHGF